MNRSEEIVQITILAGASSGTVPFTPEQGNIVAALIYPKDDVIDNPGLVRTMIKKNGGVELVKMQPIANLRSRNIEYDKDGKPMKTPGGILLNWVVDATEPFASDFLADLVLIYENEEKSQEKC